MKLIAKASNPEKAPANDAAPKKYPMRSWSWWRGYQRVKLVLRVSVMVQSFNIGRTSIRRRETARLPQHQDTRGHQQAGDNFQQISKRVKGQMFTVVFLLFHETHQCPEGE